MHACCIRSLSHSKELKEATGNVSMHGYCEYRMLCHRGNPRSNPDKTRLVHPF